MTMRRDPWRAAVAIIAGALAIADRYAPDARCTIGDMAADPGSRNTVPGLLRFPIDIRHPTAATLEAMVGELRQLVADACLSHDIEPTVEQVWHMPATPFDDGLISVVEEAAASLGYSHRRLFSGAGHDSLHVARVAPTTMIFVPCAGGLSHNEAESASPQDVTAGANVLLHAVLQVAGVTPDHL